MALSVNDTIRTFTFLIGCMSFCSPQSVGQNKLRFVNVTDFSAGYQIADATLTSEFLSAADMSVYSSSEKIRLSDFPSGALSSSFGVALRQSLLLALGVRYEAHQTCEVRNNLMHTLNGFGHVRLYFGKSVARPNLFIDGKAGYVFSGYAAANPLFDGFFIEPSLGVGLKMRRRSRFNISVGYQFRSMASRPDNDLSRLAFGGYELQV